MNTGKFQTFRRRLLPLAIMALLSFIALAQTATVYACQTGGSGGC